MYIEQEIGWAGARVVAHKHGWHLQFAFPGPDRRYNWNFIRIEKYEMNSFISDLKEIYAFTSKLSALGDDTAHVKKTVGWWRCDTRFCNGVMLEHCRECIDSEEYYLKVLAILQKVPLVGLVLVGKAQKLEG